MEHLMGAIICLSSFRRCSSQTVYMIWAETLPSTTRSMNLSSPPVYQGHQEEARSELPAYTQRPIPTPTTHRNLEPTEHIYDLTNRNHKSWVTLKILSGAPSAKQLPTYVEGEKVVGSVTLNLEHDDYIQAITISVKGQIITSVRPEDGFTFLRNSLTLWSKAMGDPRSSTPSSGPRYKGPLFGDYHWPFSLALPSEVTIPGTSANASRTFRLPQTFLERQTMVGIQYIIIVHIVRSRFRRDSKLQTMFAYIPVVRPDPPSRLRQLAYQENSPLLGPEADTEGWKVLPPVQIQGTIFSSHTIDAKCTLSLAKPLCYTRGTAIPCVLTLECQDLQALDLLSSPKAITVQLRRRVKFWVESVQHSGGRSAAWKEAVENTQLATWWPSMEGDPRDIETHKRRLNGEINLAKTLKPTSAIAHFSIDYSVVLLPFEAVAFASVDTKPLLEQQVEIATMFARGPHPRTYAPPEYEIAEREFI